MVVGCNLSYETSGIDAWFEIDANLTASLSRGNSVCSGLLSMEPSAVDVLSPSAGVLLGGDVGDSAKETLVIRDIELG